MKHFSTIIFVNLLFTIRCLMYMFLTFAHKVHRYIVYTDLDPHLFPIVISYSRISLRFEHLRAAEVYHGIRAAT